MPTPKRENKFCSRKKHLNPGAITPKNRHFYLVRQGKTPIVPCVCVCHGLTPSPPSPPHIGVTCTVASALKAANHSSTALWLPFLGGKGGQNPSDTAHPPSICSLTKMPVVISKTDWVDFFPKKTRV